ncbi:XrtA/PEP-CTERM system histidine kinase PrsK [Govanella unica]|uniref:histidine kinase n=1 Tax=Govanella unica TaxID=2975056 RepID=A0A9X3Z710_9PROT|nr:PEP-CTERM system histidine kinase PrsK [Govania unica]
MEVTFVTHAVAAVAYFFLTLLLVASWKRSGPGLWLIVASVSMTVWACVNAFSYYLPGIAQIFGSLSETFRTAGWVLFLLALLRVFWAEYGRPDYERQTRYIILGALSFLVGLDVLVALQNLDIIPRTYLLPQVVLLSRMAASIGCVFLVDNFYRNTAAKNRWGIQLLCLGLGGIFLYDFFFYADAVLSARFSRAFFEARGAINALIVPLIALSAARNPGWRLDVSVSRGVVIHTASLVGSGVYLVLMGAGGYYLRDLGGRWGGIIQFSFWFGALLLLAVILFSGQFRARMRVLINKHFFSYRYDYRAEWLRFINTVSASDLALGLQERVIQALADLVDSPGGMLWQREESGYFVRVASWNTQSKVNGTLASSDPFLRFIGERAWVVDLDEVQSAPELYEGCPIPEWISADDRVWLVVPLLHYRDELIGFVVLEEPRVPRSLNWEDRDILKTVARQIASYVAEQGSEKALAESRQFDEFNKKFAFIMHDIKNLASQLSLMVKNADRHAGNPEFQRDMILTVRDSVGKMNGLLTRLNRLRDSDGKTALVSVNLADLLKKLVGDRPSDKLGLTFSGDTALVFVKADVAQLETVFGHLLQNALEAVGDRGRVDLSLGVQDGWAVAVVADNGPGMEETFVRDELFKPFRTTKENGYGIGAFESRQIVRSFGGRLDVDSAVGKGTVMTVRLPLIDHSPVEAPGNDVEHNV